MRDHPDRIAIHDCRHGWLYRIYSRNLNLGIYRSDDHGFVGIRHKMGHRYLFTEYHWDIGPPFGTANPLEAIYLCPLECLEEKIVPLGNQPFQDNARLFDWIEQKAAELQITPESC